MMSDVMERLRAADPDPDKGYATEDDIARMVVAARTRGDAGRGHVPILRRRVSRRTMVLAGGGVAATVAAALVAPTFLPGNNANRASAAPLRAVASHLAEKPVLPPGRVLYVKWRNETISTESGEDPNDFIRLREKSTVEEWYPLVPDAGDPWNDEASSATYLTPADQERASRFTPDERRQLFLPPEGPRTAAGPMCSRLSCTTESPDRPGDPGRIMNPTISFAQTLPSDPTALETLIRADKEVDGDQTRYRVAVEGLLRYVPVPVKVRATLLMLLSETPDIEVYGERTIAGRKGIAYGHQGGGGPANAEIIDKETGVLLGDNFILDDQMRDKNPAWADLPVGTVIHTSSVLELAYVDKVKERP